ncbi:hypothetical protein TZ86_00605 [Streptococcus gordonii]|uniref:Uncharacterized protein n=1 Tax=Streptococcus gordonii TaxID=1302 RepID=A0AAW3H713_STRGN|nr:hypothetical protein TZ86_00605 [Streptococcus gordonii]
MTILEMVGLIFRGMQESDLSALIALCTESTLKR